MESSSSLAADLDYIRGLRGNQMMSASVFIVSFLTVSSSKTTHLVKIGTQKMKLLKQIVSKYLMLATVHRGECYKQMEDRHGPHLTHLSTDASGCTLALFHCHNIYIPTHDTARGSTFMQQSLWYLTLWHAFFRFEHLLRPANVRVCTIGMVGMSLEFITVCQEWSSRLICRLHLACAKSDQCLEGTQALPC